jgi:hypothetical protein
MCRRMNAFQVVVLALLGGGWNSVSAQNVADGLVGQRISQVGQRSHNPVVSPARILACQAHHQILEAGVDARSSHGLAPFLTIKLLSDELAVPSEQDIWFSDIGHFLECLARQAFADLGQRGPLAIVQMKLRPKVCF